MVKKVKYALVQLAAATVTPYMWLGYTDMTIGQRGGCLILFHCLALFGGAWLTALDNAASKSAISAGSRSGPPMLDDSSSSVVVCDFV